MDNPPPPVDNSLKTGLPEVEELRVLSLVRVAVSQPRDTKQRGWGAFAPRPPSVPVGEGVIPPPLRDGEFNRLTLVIRVVIFGVHRFPFLEGPSFDTPLVGMSPFLTVDNPVDKGE